MATLDTALDPRAPSFLDNRSTAQAALRALDHAHGQARDGGGEKEVTRHHARGKLLPRERIELLVDTDTALLELAATAGRETGEPAGAGLVTALGVVDGIECMLIANDPTVRVGGPSTAGRRKFARAVELAARHLLPLVLLLESTADDERGTGAPDPSFARLSRMAAPVLCAVFGPLDAWLAPLPDLADHALTVRGRGDATRVDVVAEDERDALRLLRQTVRQLVTFRHGPRPAESPPAGAARPDAPPRFEAEELLAVASADPRGVTEPREVLARVLDGSDLDEFRPQRGPAVLAGFGAVHGHRVAVLAATGLAVDAESADKGVELARLAANAGVPVLVLANPVVETAPDASAPLLRALSQADRMTLVLGVDPGAWTLAGPGFRFAWPVGDLTNEPYDGVIDPRDTRTVLGICLSVSASAARRGVPGHVAEREVAS
ncbi:acetyl-CoA carboxylase carboxyltransferase subunit [Catellatospora sp. IY07-71]|uniref:carboxyl transferase domain-containing protein n=1 Tax=Catellatospora sp. IY07-71 TaxID=2728827 RepID=UPI001BB31608|nr:carboxyl transferase domain-containing protein [Catellatospora sp. IY07-71]BCJ71553.1 acetyl-CoA carboxylase carboxyltransferase subunit [Catellatospora sp. IY07-71]